jgi:hypothetical protein
MILMAGSAVAQSDGFICRSIICNVVVASGENAIIEGKIALIIGDHSN